MQIDRLYGRVAVGYTGKTSGALNNFITVPFNAIGFNTCDINQIKISDGGLGTIGWGQEIFEVWEGLPTAIAGTGFAYWDPSMSLTGATDYFWGDAELNESTFKIPAGQGVVINCVAGLEISIEPPYNFNEEK